ncbi:MAG: hypothetical protein QGI63_02945 [Rhodospirillales bacterium]|jgi:acyl-coenzyme A thioesterase PaaI-like protein|nr:hypothetical protein [Rhodospirillales bacterium]MDP6773206.1 hypothetical protein [Rhodospirillales bacterium]|tara:strand:- start:425 stop:589 length:165 start_codon:yes stop_codon:yes gene_type:complete
MIARGAGPVTLRTVGKIVKVGRIAGVADAWVFDPDNKLLASRRGAYSASMPEHG